ncbi:hypothetical protein L1C77_21850 [Klebsiella pneumoniae]|uniref:hypothetical protein n=1 Tax=Klebsiella pneumoniae TaxID=573 RepID=UPI0020CD0897|nr:hypothetical protein [Klebsiella pneumoniae]MCQ0808920.1 hypothetical protein [Klebsiella pneumoniae]
MTNITELAQLRAELSNPANGSKDHLRKLALLLVEALERKEEQRANWFQMAQKLGEDLDAVEKRIAELESKLANPVQLPKTNGYWTETEKAFEEAITLAKRQVRLAGFTVEDM